MQKKKSLTNTVSYTHTHTHVIIFTAIPWMDSGLKYEKIQYTTEGKDYQLDKLDCQTYFLKR